jgi:hypothetical protein
MTSDTNHPAFPQNSLQSEAKSNQVTGPTFRLFLPLDHLLFALNYHPECLIEDLLEASLGQGTALHIPALQFLIDYPFSVFFSQWAVFGVVLGLGIPEVDLISYEDFWDIRHVLLEFGVPLS